MMIKMVQKIVSRREFLHFLPQDSYLLLGDNRNGSSDARVWEHTYVSKDDILAKAIFRYYPFNRFGAVK